MCHIEDYKNKVAHATIILPHSIHVSTQVSQYINSDYPGSHDLL